MPLKLAFLLLHKKEDHDQPTVIFPILAQSIHSTTGRVLPALAQPVN